MMHREVCVLSRVSCVWEKKKGRAVGDMAACSSYHGNDNIGIMRACVRKALLLLLCEFSKVMYATVLQITTVPCVSIYSSMISGWQYCVDRKRLNGEEELQRFCFFSFYGCAATKPSGWGESMDG